MDSAIWLPLLSGFVGALIGAGASILTVIIQSRREDRRETARLAVEIATADHAHSIDLAKLKSGRVEIAPLPVYIAYYQGLLAALAKDDFTPESYAQLAQRFRTLLRAASDQDDPEKEALRSPIVATAKPGPP